MIFVSNAFSLSMLTSDEATIKVRKVSTEEVKNLLKEEEFTSAVGHSSTADVMSKLLNVSVPVNRIQIKLQKGDTLIVFQLMKRLEEGKILSEEEIKQLPYTWFVVQVL